MNKILGVTDLPCSAHDEDTLGIQKYVEGLAHFIRRCPTPMSIALQGDWGTGKTSVIFKLQNQLENPGDLSESKIDCIYFNTWQYSQFNMSDDLYASFINSLVEKLTVNKSFGDKVKDAGSKLFSAVKLLSVGAIKKVPYVDDDAIDKILEEKHEKMKAVEELKSEFRKLVDMIAGEEGRIVIFVDDLDRLNPEAAVALLEIVKLFLDVPKCVFVLAIDYGVVVSGVRKKFGADISEEKCRSFFDKIIQLPFRMPIERYRLDKMLSETLKEYLDVNHIKPLSLMIRSTLGPNPRVFKRLANSFFLIHSVQESVDPYMDEKNEKKRNALILAVLAIQMAAPELYSEILRESDDEKLMGLIKNEGEGLKNCDDREREILDSFGNIMEAVLGGSDGSKIDFLLDVLTMSSITVVEDRENAGGRKKSQDISEIEIGGEEISVQNAAEALKLTFGKVLQQEAEKDPERVQRFIESSATYLTYDADKKNSTFRQKKAINLGGRSLFVGTSSGTPAKIGCVKKLCSSMELPEGYVKWFDPKGNRLL